ncbi:hypothetical protein POM88_007794 [Heracleum sosnowskyi]|uniref:Uncharacterized protein n=1 Tax=Heracleum sosnowskyi TaxID=360622 RepID=A0AAD8J876_9APIA|nr:hypothetical protein POM88_007794 [Heracleum sosnowskyi]
MAAVNSVPLYYLKFKVYEWLEKTSNTNLSRLWHCRSLVQFFRDLMLLCRFLNKAAIILDGDVKADGSKANPWTLCSVQQIEEVKYVGCMFWLLSSHTKAIADGKGWVRYSERRRWPERIMDGQDM